ncbi:ArsR/SmtB family transcription factor [Halomicrococcus gelatinilyticus]|uniref:ArsR/SmtB family transcription factor n=1 Tax=Halomicrococcus gelatinilyticus TaxID=1702103 RepID=UPI002E0DE4F5
MSERFVQRADPEEVFGSLSNDTRVAVIRALREADGHEATFSDLRETVGVDDPGQFNYHLGKLRGHFVTRTDEGYELTQAGKQIAGAIASGAYTVRGETDPIALDDPCQVCGGEQTLRYEDEVVRVECDSCVSTSAFAVPPAAFAGHEREEIPQVASRYLRTTIRQQYNGFCWYCEGRVEPSVGTISDIDMVEVPSEEVLEEFVDDIETIPWVQYDCQQCGATATTGLNTVLLNHPAVVAFYHDHGVDVRERLVWEFPPVDDVRMAVRDADPFRASVTYEAGGETLTVVVDETLGVVDVDP